MISRSNDRTLGEAIREMLSQYRLEGKLKQARIIEAWPEVVGDLIARHTKDIYIKGRTLFVQLDSPALKNELSYEKTTILNSLNASVGEEVITEVVFR